jgi:hypothetical protein
MAIRMRASWLLLAATGLMLLTVACGNKQNDSAKDQVAPYSGSPTALAARPNNASQTTVQINNGKLSEDGVEFQQNESGALIIDNRDGTAYVLKVGTLIAGAQIPAKQVTNVEFSSTNADQFEAQLLPADGSGDALDTMRVTIASAGNTQPTNP